MSTSTARSRRQRTNRKCLGVISLILPSAAAVIRPVAAAVDEDESENDVGGGGGQQLLGSNDSIRSKILVSLLDWSSIATQPMNRIENDDRQHLRSSSSMAASESSSLGIETNRRHHLYHDSDIIGHPLLFSDGSTARNLRSRPKRGRPKRGERSSSQEEEEHWYADWSTNRCVQSCDASSSGNPNCAGLARWDDIQFDTAEYCCSITFFWVSFEECTGGSNNSDSSSSNNSRTDDENADDDGDNMTNLSASASSGSRGGGGGGGGNGIMACPPEYSEFNGYQSRDTVTIYDDSNKEGIGHVYQCKDDAMSLYCDQFPPNWKRVAAGGGSVHTLDLGWTLLGDCEGDDGEKNSGSRGAGGGDDDQLPFDASLGNGNDDGQSSCWRSGTLCDSHAGRFACCTSCERGVCI